MDQSHHHERPELWFRPSQSLPFEVLLTSLEKEKMTTTFRLGKRDKMHPKGYVPGTVATVRLYDDDRQERLHKRVRITNVVSKALHDFPDWQSVQRDLSFFEGKQVAPTDTVSLIEFSYV